MTAAMAALAADDRVRFIGYGIRHGRAMGTLKNVAEHQLIETPVAENLMVGMAIGLSLQGFIPVVFIERMDFIMNAMDAIVNHLDKIAKISRGEFHPAVILRAVVGNRNKPLYTGATHTQDFAEPISRMVEFPVEELLSATQVNPRYLKAWSRARGDEDTAPESTLLVEYKDLM